MHERVNRRGRAVRAAETAPPPCTQTGRIRPPPDAHALAGAGAADPDAPCAHPAACAPRSRLFPRRRRRPRSGPPAAPTCARKRSGQVCLSAGRTWSARARSTRTIPRARTRARSAHALPPLEQRADEERERGGDDDVQERDMLQVRRRRREAGFHDCGHGDLERHAAPGAAPRGGRGELPHAAGGFLHPRTHSHEPRPLNFFLRLFLT